MELTLLWHVLLYSNFTIPPDNSRSPNLKTECWVHWKDEAFTLFLCFDCVLICCQSFVFKNVASAYVSGRKLLLWGLGNKVKMKCHPTVHRWPRFLLYCFIHLIDNYTEIPRVILFWNSICNGFWVDILSSSHAMPALVLRHVLRSLSQVEWLHFICPNLSEIHHLSPRLSCLSLCKYPSLGWPISTVNIMRGNFLM